MAIKASDAQRLEAIFAGYGPKYGGRKEDYFALLYLTRKFKVEPEEIAHQIAFLGNDYGLDAYFIDRDARNLYLYQFKWSEDHNQFKASMERLTKSGLNRVFGAPNQDPTQNDLIRYLKKDLKENREIIDRVYVHFVFKGDVDAAENSDGLSNRREDIENKTHLISNYFGGKEVELQVDFIADRPGHRGPPASQSYVIHLRQAGTATHDGRVMQVGFVPLMDLYGIYRALGQTFFDRNIRAALKPDNAPNKRIREALDRIVLKGTEDPSVFVFRHNGVTLAAERAKAANGEMTLYVPRLLNGAQTVSSVARFMDANADNPLLKTNRDRFKSIAVLAKIIEDDPAGDFVTGVTISNNQQNPVQPWALRAMDRRQSDLFDKFKEIGIFYSRQEGAFENLSDEEKEEIGIEESRDIRIKLLAQTFLAVQGDVYNMGHLPEVFESQKLYENTFKSTYITSSDARALVLAYKIGLMIGPVAAKLREAMPQKFQGAAPKAKNLIWAMLLQGALNDRRYHNLLEEFGGGLVKEQAFGEVLKQIGGNRVLPLLKDLLSGPAYRDKVAQEKYDFLRTTEAFRKLMATANHKYGWTKRSF